MIAGNLSCCLQIGCHRPTLPHPSQDSHHRQTFLDMTRASGRFRTTMCLVEEWTLLVLELAKGTVVTLNGLFPQSAARKRVLRGSLFTSSWVRQLFTEATMVQNLDACKAEAEPYKASIVTF